ncbi:uncharacterized protein LOC124120015 [Haliotis rufescens]|uniref:uncharacterized protein LOC124120015 n=1 Tax=Haliotis rufescens TaxID=6454 RepID=UPI00201EF96B|nr:uncharacterized protein LOC124120015 [Haliotis rufescens]XP_048240818.1 uncharacterized protein LOC124120015 [Haliotis rufescens]
MTTLLKSFQHFQLKRGVLYRVIKTEGEDQEQLVLPTRCRSAVLRSLHDNVGHPGRDRTLSLIKDRFYWPGMTKDVETHVQQCVPCLRHKTPTGRAPLVSIETSQPLELVCMDFLTLEPSKGGQQHVLVVTDHFTRYAQAYATKNMTAKTTAEVFFNNFILHYGIPKRIHSDQGANFTGNLMRELCQLLKINKSRTTPYHPMGNGMCERFNKTLCNMLGTLDPDSKKKWKAFVGPLVHAYNSTRHESTGFAPFFLMYGRHPRLPVDIAFGLDMDSAKSTSMTCYIKDLKDRLSQAYDIASSAAKKAQSRNKSLYNQKARAAVIEKGDRVLVKVVAFDGRHKLADRWEEDIYVILDQPNSSIPVFVVGKENGHGRTRTLHRNLLLPIGSLPQTAPVPKPRRIKSPQPQPKVRPRTCVNQTSREDTTGISHDEDELEDGEDMVLVTTHHSDSAGSALYPADRPPEDKPNEDVESEDQNTEVDGRDETADVEQQEQPSEEPPVPPVDVPPDRELAAAAPIPTVPPNPQPRRSVRERRPPKWMSGGEFALSAVTQPDWLSRANYLSSLIEEGLLEGQPKRLSDALLDLVTGKNT